MSLDSYLLESRYVIEQWFSNRKFYRSLYIELLEAVRAHKSFIFDKEYDSDPDDPNYELEVARYRRDTADSGKQLNVAISRLRGAVVSQNAVAGAIFQVAFMGIKLYSARSTIPVGWEQFSQQLRKCSMHQFVRFGGGRRVWGEVPLGLVIYAARNQYNHHDESPTNPLVIEVFTRLREYRQELLTFADVPTFDSSPISIANHLINVVGWSSFTELSEDLIVAVSESATSVKRNHPTPS